MSRAHQPHKEICFKLIRFKLCDIFSCVSPAGIKGQASRSRGQEDVPAVD